LLAIFDASVFVRALVEREPRAEEWVDRVFGDVELSVPSLLFAEVGNALAGYVRSGELPASGADARLEFTLRLPHAVTDVGELVPAALAVAVPRGLSVYDACYVVLAEGQDAPLVTADRRLGAAVRRAELL
jgi:predicted nucleic acid-binding protein